MPSRAFRILFGKLPHALSAAIQAPTRRIYTRTPTPAGKSASTHVRRDGRDEHKSRSAPYAYGSDASRGTAIDGCLLQLTCERRAARTLRASRWRVHATDARIPSHLSPHLRCAKEGTILSRDGCSIRQTSRISRATRPRRRDAIVDPRRPRSDATQCAPACMRVDVVCRVAFIPRGTTSYVDRPPSEKRTLENEDQRLMWPIVDAIRRIRSYGCPLNLQWILNQLWL